MSGGTSEGVSDRPVSIFNLFITEWFGLGGTLKTIQFHGQEHLPSTQAAAIPIQPGLEHFHGCSSHSLTGRVQGPQHPQSQELLPSIPPNPAFCQWEAVPPLPASPSPCPKFLTISFGAPLGTGRESKVSMEPFLLQAKHPQLS